MAQLELASESGDLEAVQAALAQARCSLDDLDLAYQLQRQEFFGDGAEDSGAESLDSSQGHDSVEELKLALELQVGVALFYMLTSAMKWKRTEIELWHSLTHRTPRGLRLGWLP